MNANGREPRIRTCTRVYLCLFVVLLSGCSTLRNREPDWVRNPKSVYPEKKYLVAIGEGDTRRSAENAAAANLSRIFESHIESDERMVDKVSETDKNFIRSTDMTTDINILSSQTLINIQHAEAWKDEKGRYHAVAYLNRRDTAGIYGDKVDEQTRRIKSLLDGAAQAGTLLEKYARLRAAFHAALENELLLRQLRIIHPPSASSAAPPYSFNAIQDAAADTAKRIRVQIQLEGDTGGQMTARLQELITRYGFVVGRPSILNVKGRMSITDTGKRTANLAFFRYNLSAQITDAEGNVIAAINETGREAVTSPDEARTRCYRTMARAIQTSGVETLDAYFDSIVNNAK